MATLPDPANATTLDSSTTSATLELFRAVLGPVQTDYYLKAFTRFDAKDRGGPSWNWVAGLLTLNWMALYRLWGAALAYVGAVLAATLLVLGIGRLAFGLSEEAQWLGMGVVLALSVAVPGVFGNALLYNHCRKKMDQALTASPTLAEACAMLRRQAASRQRVIGLGIGNGVLVAGIVGIAVAFQGLQPAVAPPSVATKTIEPVDAAVSKAPELAASALQTAASAALTAAPASTVASAASTPSVISSAPAVPAGAGADTTAPAASAVAKPASGEHPIAAAVAAASAPAPAPASVPPKVDATAKLVPSGKNIKTEKDVHSTKSEKPAAKAERATAKGEKVAAKAESESAKKWVVNVGLFADENNARNAASKLSDAGIPVLINEMDSAKGKRTRVRAGPFASQPEAERAVDKIHFIGLDAVIARK